MAVLTALYGEKGARNRPFLYATPLAWAVADFTRSLTEADGGISPHRTGMIVASDECSLPTMRELSCTASQGTVSPLRFAGASPSVVAGLPALQQGIRGPALALTMPPAHAARAIVAMIEFWIRYGDIGSVIAIAHHPQADRGHLLKGLIARSVGDELVRLVAQLCDARAGGDGPVDRELTARGPL